MCFTYPLIDPLFFNANFFFCSREIFKTLAAEDSEFTKDGDSDFEVPEFGDSQSVFDEVSGLKGSLLMPNYVCLRTVKETEVSCGESLTMVMYCNFISAHCIAKSHPFGYFMCLP